MSIPRGYIYWKSFDTKKEAEEYVKYQKEEARSWKEYYITPVANAKGKFEVYRSIF